MPLATVAHDALPDVLVGIDGRLDDDGADAARALARVEIR
jgi:hypothetical protein